MDIFVALSDPTRRLVLDRLRGGAVAAGELVQAFPNVTQPAISRHLRILRETGLVNMQPDEQRRIYSLRAEGLQELDAWLALYRPFWQQRLDALEAHLHVTTKPTKNKRTKK